MIQVAVKPDFAGPTIIELAPVIPDIKDVVIYVRWLNSRQEIQVLQQFPQCQFHLYVQDNSILERSSTSLGLRFQIEPATIELVKGALLTTTRYNWRGMVKDIGPNLSRSLITKVAADAVRSGKRPQLAFVAAECLLENIRPEDADVLIRLRTL